MSGSHAFRPDAFSASLYEKLKQLNPGVADMELYEFRYALDNLQPESDGWASVTPDPAQVIEEQINCKAFYTSIQLKPTVDGKIVLDDKVARLTNMLLVGLVTGEYSPEWIEKHFYFDIRGFYFVHRTVYFTDAVLAHLGGQPYRQFEQKQKHLERWQGVSYKEFKAANAEVDQAFIASIQKLIAARGTPLLLAVAGPTAAGKTEIVARLREILEQTGQRSTTIELDNFLTDRDYREENSIDTLGGAAMHLPLLVQSLTDICQGKKIATPRYDFVNATSSHDLGGVLKPGQVPAEVEPADIIFIEGNFPFLLPEIAPLIGVKVVYLTDDAVRLKRKWKRDVDYRKKYDPVYLRNRYFREQFLMADACYLPQLQTCDLVVDTTGAALWATPEIAEILNRG